MQPVTLVLILLVIVEVGLAGGLIWLRRRNRAASGPILPRPFPARPPAPLTLQLQRPEPVAPEPVPDEPAPAEPAALEPPAPPALRPRSDAAAGRGGGGNG